jgi:single-strand DNA-binding protein
VNFNKVILCGRSVKEIELKKTADGKSVANLTIATNNVYVNKSGQKVDKSDFHNVVLWGAIAEIAQKYCQKGTTVMIEGRLQNRSWIGNDGQKKYATDIIAEKFQLGQKPNGVSNTGTAVQNQVSNTPEEEPEPMPF